MPLFMDVHNIEGGVSAADVAGAHQLGLRYGHAEVESWVATMRDLASRAGMRELVLRSLRYGAALGNEGDAAAAAVLAEEIEIDG
jgi:hypothetical protein